jgi:hypothetical protein
LWIAGAFAALFALPGSALACDFGTQIAGGLCRGYLISGSSFTVPQDWTSTNTIEAIGAGGGGGVSGTHGGGGGGGAYSAITNYALTPGANVTYSVGAGGGTGSNGGDTSFNSVSALLAKGGAGASGKTGGAGGASSSGAGSTLYSGGGGGTGANGGGGGGGAGGPTGSGGAGSAAAGSVAGGGGGGDGGSNGGAASAPTPGQTDGAGGSGGNNASGSGGGSGGVHGTSPTAGSNGGGGGGGWGNGVSGQGGKAGGAGTEWDSSHGAGGGGGSGGYSGTYLNGGAGALYGGGGGNGQAGGQGLIVITYAPSAGGGGGGGGSGGGGVAGPTSYTYDALGRLTCTATPDGFFNSYVLDYADNRSQVVRNTTGCAGGNSSQNPVANNVNLTVLENSPATWVTLDITGGTASSVAVLGSPSHGSTTNSGSTISYKPTSGYAGQDSFRYQTNPGGSTAWVNVTVTSTAPPAAPVAENESTTVLYGSKNNAMPLTFRGGAPGGVSIVNYPGWGTLTPDGMSYSYTPTVTQPANGASTTDSFVYTGSNASGTSAPAAITITINPPTPTANNIGPVTVGYDSANNNVGPNPPVDGVNTTVAVLTQPPNGYAATNGSSLYYTPHNGYPVSGSSGPDSFEYVIKYGSQTSAAGTVSIVVDGPPVANGPTANADTMNLTGTNYFSIGLANGCIDPTTNDTSPLGYALTVIGVTSPNGAAQYGSSTIWTSGSNQVCYEAHTPSTPPGFFQDSFTYSISDGHNGTATGTITVNVTIPAPQ